MVTNPWGQRILIGSPPNIWLLNVHAHTHIHTKRKWKWNAQKKKKSANDTHGYLPYRHSKYLHTGKLKHTQSWNELTLKILYSAAWTQQVKLQVWTEAWWWSRGQIKASHFLNVNDCHEQENITFADLQNNDLLSIYAGAIITLKE